MDFLVIFFHLRNQGFFSSLYYNLNAVLKTESIIKVANFRTLSANRFGQILPVPDIDVILA